MFSLTLVIQHESHRPNVDSVLLTAWTQSDLVLLCPGCLPQSHGTALPCQVLDHPICKSFPSPDLLQSPEMAPASYMLVQFSRLTSSKQPSLIKQAYKELPTSPAGIPFVWRHLKIPFEPALL